MTQSFGHRPRIVVIGAGITGLATAYYLNQNQNIKNKYEILVLEAQKRAGGKIRTEHVRGFILESGPDSFLTSKPSAISLCHELGLSEALIPQQHPRTPYIFRRGHLIPIPSGIRLVHPTKPWSFLKSNLLSPAGRVRALLSPFISSNSVTTDESVGEFIERRYGSEMLRVLGEPLLAGIHLADPWKLSLESTFPMLRNLFKNERNINRITRVKAQETANDNPLRTSFSKDQATLPLKKSVENIFAMPELAHLRDSPFVSLTEGMEQLSQTLVGRLGSSLVTDSEVESLSNSLRGYQIKLRQNLTHFSSNELIANAIVVTTPATVAGRILNNINPLLSTLLMEAQTNSCAIVSLGYTGSNLSLPKSGSGFLVPRQEGSNILACTWSSSKWNGRAPYDGLLLRVFFGGWRNPELPNLSSHQLSNIAQEEIKKIIGSDIANGSPPSVLRVQFWPGGTPLYQVGHKTWLQSVVAASLTTPGLWLAGAAYDGVGIPDCIRQARTTAAQIALYLSELDQNKPNM